MVGVAQDGRAPGSYPGCSDRRLPSVPSIGCMAVGLAAASLALSKIAKRRPRAASTGVSREDRLDQLEAAFEAIPITPVSSPEELTRAERARGVTILKPWVRRDQLAQLASPDL